MYGSALQSEIVATKNALAALRTAVHRVFQPDTGPAARRNRHACALADDLRLLYQLYTTHTGCVLRGIGGEPLYAGPLYQWKLSPVAVTVSSIRCLNRLRRDPNVGIRTTTHFIALNYLASIWPDDLDWPPQIPRPTTSKKEAA